MHVEEDICRQGFGGKMRGHLEDPGIVGMIILKYILKK